MNAEERRAYEAQLKRWREGTRMLPELQALAEEIVSSATDDSAEEAEVRVTLRGRQAKQYLLACRLLQVMGNATPEEAMRQIVAGGVIRTLEPVSVVWDMVGTTETPDS